MPITGRALIFCRMSKKRLGEISENAILAEKCSANLDHTVTMRLKLAIPLTLATVCLPFASAVYAQTYAGGSTAGDLPATAEVVPGVAGVTYTNISGTTLATNNIYTGDMYEITIATPETFTASTTAFFPGANNFDTQLSLFNSSGVGIVTNDDAASGGEQSSLSTGGALLAPGNYYLLITGSGNYPVDSTGALIFPNFTTGVNPEGTYAATSALPIAGFTGNSNEGGNYDIGITVIPSALVPEPSTAAAIAAGVGGLVLVCRRRRSS